MKTHRTGPSWDRKFSKRSLITGTGAIAALAALPDQAQAANVPFTTFAFAASGSNQVARTEPDRLAEVKNVMDFGALGNSGDDTIAIQNAVNWTSGANRGTIFFPPGSYYISSPIALNYNGALSIKLVGCGEASTIQANGFASPGYIFDRSLVSPSNQAQVVIEKFFLSGYTSSGGGAIRMGSCASLAIRDCFIGGFNGITTEDSAGNSSQNVIIENCNIHGPSVTGLQRRYYGWQWRGDGVLIG